MAEPVWVPSFLPLVSFFPILNPFIYTNLLTKINSQLHYSGLDFTAQALRRNHNSTEELAISFTNAYENTLKKHHSIMIRPIFFLAMKACPHRDTFYGKLGEDQEKVKTQLGDWLSSLENVVTILSKHYVVRCAKL